MKILKNKEFIIFVILSFIALAAIAISVILLKKDTNNSAADNYLNSPVSFVDSISSPPLAKDYDFVNKDKFQISYKKYLYSEFCPPENYLSYPVDVASYAYNVSAKDILDKVSVVVVNDYKQYSQYDSRSNESYKQLQNLFENKTTTDNAPELSSAYSDLFSRYCTGSGTTPVGYIQKLDYPKVEKAYLVVRFGSFQSATDHTYMPLDIQFISKVADHMALSSIDMNYADLTKDNNLAPCEEQSEYGFVYIPTAKETGKNCVIKALEKDLDHEKLQKIINEYIDIFALQ